MVLEKVKADPAVASGTFVTTITDVVGFFSFLGIAVAATLRGFDPGGPRMSAEIRPFQPMVAALPALSCIDDLAGEAVLSACEKALFGSPETAAAALSYAGSLISRLTAFGDVAAANLSLIHI